MVEPRQVCIGCAKKRLLTSFPPDLRRTDKISPRCTTCHRRKSRAVTRTVRIKETYGITEVEYEAIAELQAKSFGVDMADNNGYVCGICAGRRSYKLDIDHGHAAARTVGVRASVRGLLCKSCNRRLLKAAKDSVDILHNAVDYLLSPPAQRVLGDGSNAAEADDRIEPQ